jgi:polyphosphate glucokinase
MTDARREVLGIDVGGTGIKAAMVDVERGALVTERVRVETPHPARPDALAAATAALVDGLGGREAAGIGFPSAILNGVTMTAANVDKSWIGTQAEEIFRAALGRPVVLLNDADAAGLAEMRFGAGAGERGVVLMLTLGTGIGSALFLDGRLVPNLELGHLEIRGKDAESRASAVARERKGLSWERWARRLDEFLHRVDALLWPDLIIIGGGVSKRADRFLPFLNTRPRLVPATLHNDAGIVGAALRVEELVAPEVARPTSRARPRATRAASPPGASRGQAEQ